MNQCYEQTPTIRANHELSATLLDALRVCEQDDLVTAFYTWTALQDLNTIHRDLQSEQGVSNKASPNKKLRKKLSCFLADMIERFDQSFGSLPDESFTLLAPSTVFYPQAHGGILRMVQAQCITLQLFDLRTYCPRLAPAKSSCQYHLAPHSVVSLALLPWQYALSSRLCMLDTLCRAERYEFLASAIWLMTYFGLDEQTVREGQKREYQRRIKQGILTPLLHEDIWMAYRDQIRGIEVGFDVARALDLDGPAWQKHIHQAHLLQSVIDLNEAQKKQFASCIEDFVCQEH